MVRLALRPMNAQLGDVGYKGKGQPKLYTVFRTHSLTGIFPLSLKY